jgi:hypothetical protein
MDFRAHAVLRTRRQILAHKPHWALGREGLRQLTGRGSIVAPAESGREGDDGADRSG